ncbi:hypothetical protein [Oryzihumus sp.]
MLHDDVAWLLRTARRFARDEALRDQVVFARGAADAPPVDPAVVARWESGQVAPSYALVERYETVLGLPQGQLLTAVDTLARQEEPVRAEPVLRPPRPAAPSARALQLLERALASEPMTAADWDELSALMAGMSHVLIRAGDSEALLRRALLEMSVSTGLDYARRTEGIARLAGHPQIAPVIVDLASATLEDPDAQVYSEIVALLNFTGMPGAGPLLARHVESPVNANALRAALFTAASQVRRRRLPAELTGRLCRLAWEHLTSEHSSYRVRRSAANLIRAVDEPTRHRVAEAVLNGDRDSAAAAVLLGEGARPRTAAQRVMEQVRGHLVEALGEPLEQHPTLLRLLDQAAQDTNEESRGSALAVLMLCPVGPALGRAYGQQLRLSLAEGDRVGAHEALSVLTWMPQPHDLDLLTDLAVGASPAGGGDEDLPVEASWAVGNCPEPDRSTAASREERLAARVAELVDEPGPAGLDAEGRDRQLTALAYALGMRGRTDLLAGGPDLPAWRSSADWWLQLPDYVRPQAGVPAP